MSHSQADQGKRQSSRGRRRAGKTGPYQMYYMLSHFRESICVPANYSGSQYSDQYTAALIFSSMMCSLEDSIPPGILLHWSMDRTVFLFHLLHGVQRPSFSSSSLCSKPPHQSAFLLFMSTSVPLFHHSHVSPQLLLCNIVFLLLLLPPQTCLRAAAS